MRHKSHRVRPTQWLEHKGRGLTHAALSIADALELVPSPPVVEGLCGEGGALRGLRGPCELQQCAGEKDGLVMQITRGIPQALQDRKDVARLETILNEKKRQAVAA